MIINVLWNASVAQAPAGFQEAVNTVVSFFRGRFTDDITFNLHVGYGEVNGAALNAGNIGQSTFTARQYTYDQIRTALTNDRLTADDFTAVGTLPATDPFPGTSATRDIWVIEAEAAALGLLPEGTPIETHIGFSNTDTFDYTRNDGITAGQYDFMGIVAHELTHAMGRFLGVGENNAIGGATSDPDYMPLDLFHYRAGTRTFTRGGYFGIEPSRVLADFNDLTTGTSSDWAPSAGNDSFLNVSFSGVYNDITPRDLRLMDVIGYDGYPDDYGDDVNFAWHISPGGIEGGSIELMHDNDWFRVFLNAGERYRMNLRGADSGGGSLADPFLAIWNDSSIQLAQDNDSGAGRDAQLVFTPPASGYYYVSAHGFFGAYTGNYTLGLSRLADHDFNNDGRSDIVLQGGPNVVEWFLQGGAYAGGHTVSSSLPAGWSVVATGDFNRDGFSDLALQGGSTVVEWFLNASGQYTGGNVISTDLPPGWSVVGAGDVNRNGVTDLFLHGGNTVVNWVLNASGGYQTGNVLATHLPPGWQVVGTGDLNGDGIADVVLQGGSTVVAWLLNSSGAYAGGSVLSTTLPFGWMVAGIGDFNGDRTSDILVHGGNMVVDWIMQGGNVVGGHVLSSTLPAGWRPTGTGDYNGDGTTDISLQGGATVVDWLMQNGQYSSGNVLSTTVPSGWNVAAKT